MYRMDKRLLEDDDSKEERPKKVFKLSFIKRDNIEIESLSLKTENQDNVDKETYPSTVLKMMSKMGYKPGKGLGIAEQGIISPIEASKQRGRRGLGVIVKNFEPTSDEWDYSQEEISVPETVDWISADKFIVNLDDLTMEVGPEKLTIDDEDGFVSDKILSDILRCKSVFDELEGREMLDARTRSNPFETIKSGIFINRAAMKMANMDSLLDYIFTSPKTLQGHPLIQENDLLYFADICAGPGGFTEYVLWRKKRLVKGFGFTLKGQNDFNLENFTVADKEYFEPHYGVNGLNGDGDIFNTNNILEFQKFVLENTFNLGVHFVMADGGFSVEGQENIQEILSKRLYLCQFLTALLILRPGGHFVCKLFDIFTPFSISLIYLIYHAFERISIIKPVTSRPANSERYIVCYSKHPDTELISNHLIQVNQTIDILGEGKSVNVVCPIEKVFADQKFYDYIRTSNEKIGRQQVIGLAKIKYFAQNVSLIDLRQNNIRSKCLELWRIPDEPKKTGKELNESPHIAFQRLTRESKYESDRVYLLPSTIDNIKSIYDYRCVVLASEKQFLLLGLGSSMVYKFDYINSNQKWIKIDDVQIQLPRNTLLDVEIVEEFRGEGHGQIKLHSFHVIDGLFLGGDDVRLIPYEERIEKTKSFIRAITRPTKTNLSTIRVKEVTHLENIKDIFDSLKMRQGKNISQMRRPTLDVEDSSRDGKPRYFVPHSIYLPRLLAEPWMLAYSRSQARFYYYHTMERRSQFEVPAGSYADFKRMFASRLVWNLSRLRLGEDLSAVAAEKEQSASVAMATAAPGNNEQEALTVRQMVDFVRNKLNGF